jgi:hypothetical protein
MPRDGAVILIGHVNRLTARGMDGEGYSGSTAWHNSVRARWYLHREQDAEGEGSGRLILKLEKANLSGYEVRVPLQWDGSAHLFVGHVEKTGRMEREHRDHGERLGILHALRAAGDGVPAATTGRRTAYHVLEARSEFPASLRHEVRRFWRRIEELRQMRYIEESSIRRANRHQTVTLVLTSEGLRQCAE